MTECAIDNYGTLDLVIAFDNSRGKPVNPATDSTRDTMMKAMLGQFLTASQSTKQELKQQAESQVHELKTKLAERGVKFQ